MCIGLLIVLPPIQQFIQTYTLKFNANNLLAGFGRLQGYHYQRNLPDLTGQLTGMSCQLAALSVVKA
ncbi:MAG: hypothetical protein HOP23_10155 [Methylococcaceae bacterium]|nr:hypothetical protein [Methylococcaceae bacterium]